LNAETVSRNRSLIRPSHARWRRAAEPNALSVTTKRLAPDELTERWSGDQRHEDELFERIFDSLRLDTLSRSPARCVVLDGR